MKAALPTKLLLPAIAMISASALAYEILLMRLLSIVQWHHFAYMVISLALLGYGASGPLIAIWREVIERRFAACFVISASAFGGLSAACFVIAQRLPFNALEIVWDNRQWLYLLGLYLLFFLPFLFAATCIGMTFTCYRQRINQIYLADLVGAGSGAVLIILALYRWRPETCLLGLAALALLAALLLTTQIQQRQAQISLTAIVITLLAGLLLIPQDWLDLRISPYKGLSQSLAIMDTELIVEHSSPLGLVSVVASPTVPFRHAPGLSFNSVAEPPEQLGLFTDGDGFSPINRNQEAVDSNTYLKGTYLKDTYFIDSMIALPYLLLDKPRGLVLGAGGGSGVQGALAMGARQVDAVELNPAIASLVRDRFNEFAGGLYRSNKVRLHIAEARGFVARSTERFDLIQVTMLDSLASSGAGIHGLSESYLYTVEALQEYLQHLAPGGILAIDRWLKLPPRDGLKLFATAIDALRALNVADPSKQLAMVRSWNSTTLLIKNGAWTGQQLERLRQFSSSRAFDLCYYPGIDGEEPNRYNRLDRPYFFEGATALLGPLAQRYIADYKFQIAPATDDRPFFFHFFKWRSLPELLSLSRSGGAALVEWSYLILFATLLQAVFAGAVLIVGPLWYMERKSAQSVPFNQTLWRGSYFLLLGFAFIFIEMAFIQKFILFLSHPLYAVAVVLSGFLVFAGLGSGCSAVLVRRWAAQPLLPIAVCVTGILMITTAYLFMLPPFFGTYIGAEDPQRILWTLALIAPLAFCMGMPFPLGLSRLAQSASGFIPWAWGLNGFASVVGAVLATVIAIDFGFSVVLVLALGLYLLAWFFYRFV